VIEQAFGLSSAWTVGVEEELMILDDETLEQTPAVDVLVAEGPEGPARLKRELFASVVELNTSVCETPGEAIGQLRELRQAAGEIAERHGLRVAAAGSHPVSAAVDQRIADEPDYREFVAYAGISAKRQGVNGLHVHVGMPTADACARALEGVLPWLPLVLAVSANSPYLGGEETGLASSRAEVLAQLPRAGAPPELGSYEAWESLVERWLQAGLLSRYTAIWWDVRPHPKFGTLEVRMPDQPTELSVTGAFVAVLQALCAWAADSTGARYEGASRADYDQNRWAALRFGPRAELLHPDGGERLVPVPELWAELLEVVGPTLDELGTRELVAGIDPERCEGDRQLEVGRAEGLRAVCADLSERTLRSAA
jgi:glutamate---cysteine ligase / carboxylate-amine ligase